MAIRLLSDLHLEFMPYDLVPLDTDENDVLVLAGDIGVISKPETFKNVETWINSQRFKQIIHVCGNHEFYSGSLITSREDLMLRILQSDTMALNDEIVKVGDVSFICSTLWTSFNNNNPLVKAYLTTYMNDYAYIKTGTLEKPYERHIWPDDLFNEFDASKAFIFDAIKTEKAAGQKTVVVTHHAPTLKSIHPDFAGHPANWGFASDLEQEILDSQPNLWLHGHTHNCFDYKIGETRIVCNPRGYASKSLKDKSVINENGKLNPILRLEI